MFILDTDHISLFQRRDAAVSARVLATPAVELARIGSRLISASDHDGYVTRLSTATLLE